MLLPWGFSWELKSRMLENQPSQRQRPLLWIWSFMPDFSASFSLFYTKLVLSVVNETAAHLSLNWDVASCFIFEALIWKDTELPCTHNKQPVNSCFQTQEVLLPALCFQICQSCKSLSLNFNRLRRSSTKVQSVNRCFILFKGRSLISCSDV